MGGAGGAGRGEWRMEPAAPGSELYELDPQQFTAARKALVKQLRSEGRREDAAAVARLRRPPATAWALNQLARERPELVEAVLAAGEKLRSAMERALAGDASAMKEAQQGERRAIDAATAAAATRLEATGRPAGQPPRQRMAASLRAAVMDLSVAEALMAGVLDTDHDAAGFGLEGLAAAGSDQSGGERRREVEPLRPEAPTAPAPDERDEAHQASETERHDRRRAHEHLASEAEQRARDADRAAAAAERRAQELRAAANAAAAEAERAARRAEALEKETGKAERTAERDRAAAAEAAAQAAFARRRAGAGD